MKDVEMKMLERAKALLASGEVARVIGWKKGEFEFDPVPASFETVEELDGFIEEHCKNLGIAVSGKDIFSCIGELSQNIVAEKFGKETACGIKLDDEIPARPPVMCAGCPHRGLFYTLAKNKITVIGDIGCYTLGNAMPLDMCDTCLCMGAGIGIAQGVGHIEPDTKCFAFVGDSTFFASGITGTVNAFYNQADMTLIVLDNSTTAMTGHQPHPGTGRTVMGQVVEKVSIERVLRAIGLTVVETVDPLDYALSVETVKRVADEPGVKAIIFRSPCIAISKPKGRSQVDPDKCVGCKKCIRELGCPALILDEDGKKAKIDTSVCTGCTLCEQLCPAKAISGSRFLGKSLGDAAEIRNSTF